MTKRILLALVVGLAVAMLFRNVKNYYVRRDRTDLVGIVAALLMLIGGIGLFIAFYGSSGGV